MKEGVHRLEVPKDVQPFKRLYEKFFFEYLERRERETRKQFRSRVKAIAKSHMGEPFKEEPPVKLYWANGKAWGLITWDPTNEERVILKLLFVHRTRRNRGFGTALLNSFLSEYSDVPEIVLLNPTPAGLGLLITKGLVVPQSGGWLEAQRNCIFGLQKYREPKLRLTKRINTAGPQAPR